MEVFPLRKYKKMSVGKVEGMSKSRNTYFDFLRGVAIIMVIAIHTYHKADDSVAFRQILNAAVPLFIAISGFFLSKKQIEQKTQYVQFLKRQIPKVYIPTIVWSLPLFAASVKSGENVLSNVISLFICGFSIYYFIAFIIQCYIILPFLKIAEMKWHRGGEILSCLISIIWIGLYVLYRENGGMPLPTIAYAGPLPCWIGFFTLGIALGMSPKRDYNLSWPLTLLLIGIVMSILTSNYFHVGDGQKPSSFVYSIGLVLMLFNARVEGVIKSNNILYRSVLWIGEISFAVYLMHMYIVRFVLLHIAITNWFFRALFVLVVTTAIIFILKRILPSRVHKYIGL